jgi:tetratricopeptide (TPR) repeat protein
MRLSQRLVDHTGQIYFDFEPASGGEPTLYAEAVEAGIHDLCDEALLLEEEGRLEEALETYRRALQLQPDHATLHFDLGNTQYQLGLHDEALRTFRRATELDGDFAMAWHNLGSVYAQQQAWDEAVSALQRAIQLVPEYADSHATLAQILRIQGKHAAAADHERASQMHSKAAALLAKRSHGLRVISDDCSGA